MEGGSTGIFFVRGETKNLDVWGGKQWIKLFSYLKFCPLLTFNKSKNVFSETES